MKLIDSMGYNENLSWCRPYISEDGRYAVAINEGEICGMILDGEPVEPVINQDRRWETIYTDEMIERFARSVNPNYDMYKGYDDLHIALERLREVGCCECPFCGECEAVNEEIEDTEA